jgi:hypothetical protein
MTRFHLDMPDPTRARQLYPDVLPAHSTMLGDELQISAPAASARSQLYCLEPRSNGAGDGVGIRMPRSDPGVEYGAGGLHWP